MISSKCINLINIKLVIDNGEKSILRTNTAKLFIYIYIYIYIYIETNHFLVYAVFFFYADKVTCDINKATRSKSKLLFILAAIKFCNSMPPAIPAAPLKLFSGCESIHFWMEKSFCFPSKDCALQHVHFLSR